MLPLARYAVARILGQSVTAWARDLAAGWNRFWFTPSEPHTLALIRVLAGAMLFYTHLVWALDFDAFLGPRSWVTAETAREYHQLNDIFGWSYLWYLESPGLLWAQHLFGLAVFAMLTLGLWTRVTSVVAWFIAIQYCHRLTGALYGLDQANTLLATYLMIGPSGAAYSLDFWLARRRGRELGRPTVSANLAIRLMQLHLCVVYLFGGIGKMRGEFWWDGSATWMAVANLEYQSFDMTWLWRYPAVLALLTHITVFWETFYCVLIWPRLTRTITLLLAVCVHGGIWLFLGMKTFGLAMLFVNLSFVSPRTVRSVLSRNRP